MAGSLTSTHQEHRTVRKLSLTWTSDGSGDVNGNASPVFSGEILKVTFEPGSGGNQPSDLYDVVLNDEEGVDLLQGLGANLSNGNTTSVVPLDGDGTAADSVRVANDGAVTPVVQNAGATKQGTIHIFYR